MGNEQERLFQLGWLSAIIEGEGNISLTWTKRKCNKFIQLSPRIQVTNKDKQVIDRIKSILNILNIGCYINKYKDIYKISICGMKRCNKLSRIIKDYMLGKRERTNLLYEYTFYRLSNKKRYSKYDKDVFLKMRKLNGKPIKKTEELKLLFEIESSTTTRQTPKTREEDIV
jgi:hypothetical protein